MWGLVCERAAHRAAVSRADEVGVAGASPRATQLTCFATQLTCFAFHMPATAAAAAARARAQMTTTRSWQSGRITADLPGRCLATAEEEDFLQSTRRPPQEDRSKYEPLTNVAEKTPIAIKANRSHGPCWHLAEWLLRMPHRMACLRHAV